MTDYVLEELDTPATICVLITEIFSSSSPPEKTHTKLIPDISCTKKPENLLSRKKYLVKYNQKITNPSPPGKIYPSKPFQVMFYPIYCSKF